MTSVRLWLGHDGYRDPDDNLGLLVGAAQARVTARGSDDLRVAGVVFGDTKDGAQFKMLKPYGTIPAALDDGDPRYDDALSNRNAAGNYAFYKDYGSAAIRDLAPGWGRYDLLAEDAGGTRAWNYDPAGRSAITKAARDLADDIVDAVARGGGLEPNAVVVYSAGGGAHVPAEAIAYLRNQGYAEATLVKHFAVIQHGDSNWWRNQESAATAITRPYTIALSEQDPDRYANGDAGPGLKLLVRDGVWLSGERFGDAFAEATAVAQGRAPFENLPQQARFRPTKDGSDAGSHAFGADVDALLAAWDDRLGPGEDIATGSGTEHLVDTGSGYRGRVMYDEFDWRDARGLMNGTGLAAHDHGAGVLDWG